MNHTDDRNEWKEAVMQALCDTGMDAPIDMPPLQVLNSIIEMRVMMATDPAINAPKFDPLVYMASNKKCYDKGVADGLKKAQQVAVPDGYVLVPIEPTFEQIMAAAKAAKEYMDECGGNSPSVIYEAMLAAAQGAKP